MTNLNQVPANLPVPIDDGLADHLIGMSLPSLAYWQLTAIKLI